MIKYRFKKTTMTDEATWVHPAQYTKADSIKISRKTNKSRGSEKWYLIQQTLQKSATDINAEKTQLSFTNLEFYYFIT